MLIKKMLLLVLILAGCYAGAATLQELQKKAGAGDAKAQLELGLCYAEGKKGTTKDWLKAVYWWTMAAEQGLADLMTSR